jgi:outer membrane receptor protein involved in Fe transport
MTIQRFRTGVAAAILTGVFAVGAQAQDAPVRPIDDSSAAEAPADPAPEPAEASPSGEAPAAAPAEPDANVSASGDETGAATQVASFAITKLKDSPAVVTVISGEDIRTSGARDLIDILYMVPGAFVGQDVQNVVGAGFRGLWGEEGKILIMIDGKEINELMFSTLQLDNGFPVELIERVEVVRGPGSVIYGGLAELSVVNIVTRGLQGATDATAHLVYGQMTGANSASTGYARRRVTVSGRYVVDAVPGLSTYASLSLGEGQRSVSQFTDNTGATASMEGGSALNPSMIQAGIGYRDVQATFLYQRLGNNSIAPSGFVVPTPPQVTTFDSYYGELVGTFRPSNTLEIVPRFNVTYQRPWQAADPINEPFYYQTSVRRIRGRLLGRWAPIDELQISVGGDAMFDEARLLVPAQSPPIGTQLLFNNGQDNIAYQTYGTFLELYSENPFLNVSAGVRYEHLSTIGGDLVPRLVLLKTIGPLSLKGLFSLSFRAPGVENISLSGMGAPIRPEHTTIFEFEAGLDLPGKQKIAANLFDIRIDAPIAYTLDPMNPAGQGYINLGKQGSRGFEVTYSVRAPSAKLEANYSFYAPTFADNLAAYTVPGHPDQFMGAPAHRVHARGTVWVWERIGISPSVLVLGPHFTRGPDDPASTPTNPIRTATEIPTQALANLYVFKDNLGTPGLSLGLGVYNIFGAKYEYVHISTSAQQYTDDQAPFPGLDREVMLRLSYQYEK